MNVGKNIKKIRDLKNVSQDKLSKLSNLPRTSIGRYERGERIPNIDTLNKIADALNVSIDIFIRWDNLLNENPDVHMFLARILNIHDFDDFLLKYSNLLNLDPDTLEFLTFLNGSSGNKNLYLKIADILNLTEKQLYNWILYDVLRSTIDENSIKSDDIINIMPHLCEQTIDDLFFNGLSAKNKDIIKDFLNKKHQPIVFKDNKITKPLKENLFLNSDYSVIETLLRSINKDYILSTLTNRQFDYLLKRIQEFLEYEIYKIESENKK